MMYAKYCRLRQLLEQTMAWVPLVETGAGAGAAVALAASVLFSPIAVSTVTVSTLRVAYADAYHKQLANTTNTSQKRMIQSTELMTASTASQSQVPQTALPATGRGQPKVTNC